MFAATENPKLVTGGLLALLAASSSLAASHLQAPAVVASPPRLLTIPKSQPAPPDFATRSERKQLRHPTRVRTWKITYTAHDGASRAAFVALPAWYGPQRNPPLPLIISPHGRGLDGEGNARLWGNLPAKGSFAVVSADGEGRRLGRFSWGASGQIDDLARMPELVHDALPWLRVDSARVYAVGGSMGGQETLLLVARHPEVLAGAAAIDSVTDFALQYRNYPRLGCNEQCLSMLGRPLGSVLQDLARHEVGGTPASAPEAFAARSPLSQATAIAASCVPLQIWWSRVDDIAVDSKLQSGRLARTLRKLGTHASLEEFRGGWIHTAVMRADRQLPLIVERFGLLAPRWGKRPAGVRYVATSGSGCESN
jgi:pimeloyl-ACP methyl ester carboxylesterase